MNLYLYIPPHSSHPPDVIRSLIFGRVRAYFLHNTHKDSYIKNCCFLAKYLGKRGWKWDTLKSHFTEAHSHLVNIGKTNLLAQSMLTRREKRKQKTNKKKLLVFKLPFHPREIQRQQIRKVFEATLAPLLTDRKLIIAQCQPVNICDRVCSAALEDIPGANPSDRLNADLK